MNEKNGAPLHLILMVLACVMFAIGAFGWLAPIEPYRTKVIASGLFFWSLSTFF